MAFWRRSKGRHALGAAVRSLPAAPLRSAPLPAAAPVHASAPAAAPAPLLPTVAAPPPAPPAPSSTDWSFPELVPPAEPAVTGPRVELTFRDGSSASLDAVQARALDEIAQVLTRRDEVKH